MKRNQLQTKPKIISNLKKKQNHQEISTETISLFTQYKNYINQQVEISIERRQKAMILFQSNN